MFDDFDDTASFLDDLEDEPGLILDDVSPPAPRGKGGRSSGRILGMTDIQSFIISALLFFEVGIMGYFFMIVANKMALP